MDNIPGSVTKAKRKFNDPIIVIAGDFYQWKVGEVLKDFIDIREPPLETDNQNAVLPAIRERRPECYNRIFMQLFLCPERVKHLYCISHSLPASVHC